MQIGDSENLQFLDIKLRIDYDNKIITDVYAKSTNSSTYVSPSKWSLPTIIENKNNLQENVARFLKRVWPFWDIMH